MLNNFDSLRATTKPNDETNQQVNNKLKHLNLSQQLLDQIKQSINDEETLNKEEEENLHIANELANAILQDNIDQAEQFLNIYDNKIPKHFSQERISQIKEKSRELLDNYTNHLPIDHHNNDLTHSTNDQQAFDKMTSNHQLIKEDTTNKNGKITLNETYFMNNKHAMSNEQLEADDSNHNSIEIENDKLYKNLLLSDENESTTGNNKASFSLPKLTSSSSTSTSNAANISLNLANSRFVTNQYYQMTKDNKRNESQVNFVADEIYEAAAVAEEEEVDDDDDDVDMDVDQDDESAQDDLTDDQLDNKSNKLTNKQLKLNRNDSISSSKSAVSTASTTSSNKTSYSSDSTAMPSKDKKDGDNLSKEKFDNLVKQEKLKQEMLQSTAEMEDKNIKEILSNLNNNEYKVEEANKYKDEERLLKTMQNECKYGTNNVNKASMLASGYLQGIYTHPFLKATQNTANSLSSSSTERYSSSLKHSDQLALSSSSSSSTSCSIIKKSMKSDFDKNDDEEDDEDEEAQVKQRKVNESFLIDEYKSKMFTANSQTSSSAKLPDDPSTFLLDDLLSKLDKKVITAATQAPATSKYQFNNYKNQSVDDKIKSDLLTLPSTSTVKDTLYYSSSDVTSFKTSNSRPIKTIAYTDETVLEMIDDDDDNEAVATNKINSKKEEEKEADKKRNLKSKLINQKSSTNAMDSHGSSLTNSSKQDDDEDDDDDGDEEDGDENDEDEDDFSKLDGKEDAYSYERYHIKETINELTEQHVKQAKSSFLMNGIKTSNFSSQSTMPSATVTTNTSSSSASTSLLDNKKASSKQVNLKATTTTTSSSTSSSTTNAAGIYHQKFQNFAYDPNNSLLTAKSTTKTPLLLNSNTTSTKLPVNTTTTTTVTATAASATNKSNSKRNNQQQEAANAANNSSSYSQYYVDDEMELLNFINSNSKKNTSKTSNANNKSSKMANTKNASSANNEASANDKKKKNDEASKNTKKKQPQQQQTKNSNNNNNNNKDIVIAGKNEVQEKKPSQYPPSSQSLTKAPAIHHSESDHEASKKSKDSSLSSKSIDLVNQVANNVNKVRLDENVAKKTNEKEEETKKTNVSDFVDDHKLLINSIEQLSVMQDEEINENEFVTVKKNKNIKNNKANSKHQQQSTSKPFTQSQQPQVQQRKQPASSLLSTSNQQRDKDYKPANAASTSVQSSAAVKINRPTTNLSAATLTLIKSNDQLKSNLQKPPTASISVSSSSSSGSNASLNSTNKNVNNKANNDVTTFTNQQSPAQPQPQQLKKETNPKAAQNSSSEVVVNVLIDNQFPPLVPPSSSNKIPQISQEMSQHKQDDKLDKSIANTTMATTTSGAPTAKKEEINEIKSENQAKNSININQSIIKSHTTYQIKSDVHQQPPPPKNPSVIFLDELVAKNRKTSNQKHQQFGGDVLNGIKFGFIDSSLSENEDELSGATRVNQSQPTSSTKPTDNDELSSSSSSFNSSSVVTESSSNKLYKNLIRDLKASNNDTFSFLSSTSTSSSHHPSTGYNLEEKSEKINKYVNRRNDQSTVGGESKQLKKKKRASNGNFSSSSNYSTSVLSSTTTTSHTNTKRKGQMTRHPTATTLSSTSTSSSDIESVNTATDYNEKSNEYQQEDEFKARKATKSSSVNTANTKTSTQKQYTKLKRSSKNSKQQSLTETDNDNAASIVALNENENSSAANSIDVINKTINEEGHNVMLPSHPQQMVQPIQTTNGSEMLQYHSMIPNQPYLHPSNLANGGYVMMPPMSMLPQNYSQPTPPPASIPAYYYYNPYFAAAAAASLYSTPPVPTLNQQNTSFMTTPATATTQQQVMMMPPPPQMPPSGQYYQAYDTNITSEISANQMAPHHIVYTGANTSLIPSNFPQQQAPMPQSYYNGPIYMSNQPMMTVGGPQPPQNLYQYPTTAPLPPPLSQQPSHITYVPPQQQHQQQPENENEEEQPKENEHENTQKSEDIPENLASNQEKSDNQKDMREDKVQNETDNKERKDEASSILNSNEHEENNSNNKSSPSQQQAHNQPEVLSLPTPIPQHHHLPPSLQAYNQYLLAKNQAPLHQQPQSIAATYTTLIQHQAISNEASSTSSSQKQQQQQQTSITQNETSQNSNNYTTVAGQGKKMPGNKYNNRYQRNSNYQRNNSNKMNTFNSNNNQQHMYQLASGLNNMRLSAASQQQPVLSYANATGAYYYNNHVTMMPISSTNDMQHQYSNYTNASSANGYNTYYYPAPQYMSMPSTSIPPPPPPPPTQFLQPIYASTNATNTTDNSTTSASQQQM